ncbi:cbb3-type cytochrome oxidase subunit 3 [Dongia sp.]|uniref:cbb3-type cytochrome oxidase subunit 3 n=1 Tax=Dongia sp. TaxID=1977262 RepID=UPI0035B0DAC2
MSMHELSTAARELWVVWLLIIFGAIVFHAYRKRNKDHFADCAQIPFREDAEEMNNHG